MKKTISIMGAFIGMLIIIMITTISLGIFDLEWSKFYKPRKENIRRNVFENTQSYVHGKSQELAKYYEEYRKSDNEEDKSAISSMVIMKFSDFNTLQLNSPKLKQFLTSIRGY